MGKEVKYSWYLPLTINLVHHIINAGVVPLGVEEKFSVNEKGGAIQKVVQPMTTPY